jgi:hypothetical protein
VLRVRQPLPPTSRRVVKTFERRIEASVEAVWSIISDPYAMVRTDPHTRVVSTHGGAGEAGSGYTVVSHGLSMERVVVESVVGELFVIRQVFKNKTERHECPEQRGELRRDGDATLLTWTLSEPVLPGLVRPVAYLTTRFGVPRWLSRLEREAKHASL